MIGSLHKVALVAVSATCLIAPIAFFLMEYFLIKRMYMIPLVFEILVLFFGIYVGSIQAWIVLSIRNVGSRCLVLGLAYNLGAALLAGWTPLIATLLTSWLGTLSVAFYLSANALVSALTIFFSVRHAQLMSRQEATKTMDDHGSLSETSERGGALSEPSEHMNHSPPSYQFER